MPERTPRVKPVLPTGVELTETLRANLLDPASWRAGLEKYAKAMRLAAALTDADGHLLGDVINPRPTWSMFRARGSPLADDCPFSLFSPERCTCVADALAGSGMAVARDRTGLVHIAVPLMLDGQRLGALLAGQVFDQYPDQAVLEHLAGKLNLSAKEVWQKTRLEQPLKRATLCTYGDLLMTLGNSFLQTRYHTMVEANRVAELTLLRDLLQERAQELAQADQRKDEFLATLAHELRNPLAPIRNSLHIMRLGRNNGETVEQARAMMERQVEQMVRLVDDLLDASRITRNKLELRKECIDLAAVVNSAIETSRPLIEQAGHELTVALPTQPVYLDADLTRLGQVFSNLLNNSTKYMERGGHIWLTAERTGDGITVSVRDTGIGIPAEILPHVFEMFVQAKQSPERPQGGLGIGLTLVKRLVEMHDGNIEAHSGGRGRGSEFIVRLPALPDARKAELPRPHIDDRHPTRSCHVLVVDDNVDAADSLATLLRLHGHEVQVAHDGPAGLSAVQADPPDLVILDLGMQGMDGFEVARCLRELPEAKDTLLVALTGFAQEQDRRRCYEAGFDAHLSKPVELEALQQFLTGPKSVRGTAPRNICARP